MANNVPSYYRRIFDQHLKNGVPEINVGKIQNVVHVDEVADLPDPSGGVHSLEPFTAYQFDGFVMSDAGLELAASTPLLGSHGGLDGFIHTGGQTAITATNSPFFARDLYVHAPGGTIMDLTGTTGTEMLVESVAFSDAAGMGAIADLGTIDGYRVPKFGGCNFEDFESGLTFTGTSEKIFFEGCPTRSIDAAGVSIFEFDADFQTGIVSLSDNYTVNVQPDTQVIDTAPGATITGIFQYKGNTHGGSVTESNIFGGALSVDEVGVRVSDSFPLTDSTSFVGYTLDADVATTTINQQATTKNDGAAYEPVAGTTTTSGAARFDSGDNTATFRGKRTRITQLSASISLSTGSTDVVAVGWFQNGSLLDQTVARVQMNQQGGGIAKNLASSGVATDVDTGDTFDVRVANLGSTTDIQVGDLNAQITT